MLLTQGGQFCGDRLSGFGQHIITDPEFKQVTENVKRPCFPCRATQKLPQDSGDLLARVFEVQIRDENRVHDWPWRRDYSCPGLMIWTRSMTTGTTGTSE
jgi:hypothetical protein